MRPAYPRTRRILGLILAFAAASAFAAGRPAPAISGEDPGQGDSWVRIGVVAASARGMEGDKPLRYAYRDGERLGSMLASVGQIDSANLYVLKAEGKEGFRKALQRIGGRIGELKGGNRKVFLQFYYSGHGGAKRFHFADGTLSFDEVKAALGSDRADARVYVLDVCFGASFFNSKGFRTAPPVQLQMEMDRAARGEVTISSSSMDEQAYEVKTLGGSIFTSHWIMALRGAGDRNRDGQVTLFEAYNYAYDRTAGYSAETLDRPQHPAFQMDLTGARDVTLARLLQTSTGILFKGCPAGLYNVVDLQRGIQIGELRIPKGEEFTLALEPGRYRISYMSARPGGGPSQAADLDLANAAMASLSFAAFRPQAAAPGQSKGSGPEAPAEDAYPREEMEGETGATADRGSAGRSGAGEGADRAASPRPEESSSLRVGLWDRMGYSAWLGASRFDDPGLARNLSAVPEVDRYFGTSGTFVLPPYKPDWGFDMTWALGGDWTTGVRLGFAQAAYALEAKGREPLTTLPDSARERYPVSLAWKYDFRDTRLGAMLGRTFRLGPSQGLSIEAGASFLTRTVSGERILSRPLYESTGRTASETSGDGYRLEAGLAYRLLLPPRLIGKGLAFGLRLSPYYARISGLRDGNGMDLGVEEAGLSGALTLDLLGRSGTGTAFPGTGRRNP